jgi:hypothetical protein
MARHREALVVLAGVPRMQSAQSLGLLPNMVQSNTWLAHGGTIDGGHIEVMS